MQVMAEYNNPMEYFYFVGLLVFGNIKGKNLTTI